MGQRFRLKVTNILRTDKDIKKKSGGCPPLLKEMVEYQAASMVSPS